jgi:SAM-dependent MidA family methyltransferase
MPTPSFYRSSNRHADFTPNLPPLNLHERDECEALASHIHMEIDSHGGAIDFSRFMELALYTPGMGYYSAGRHQFRPTVDFADQSGLKGAGELPADYSTASELGPVFAHCLARQCRQIFEEIGGGSILEAGAGSGLLAARLLQELEALNALPDRYLILELSGELRIRQMAAITHLVPRLVERVHWLDTLPRTGFQGIVLGNELLDAMAVDRFLSSDQEVFQFCVTRHNGGFDWDTRPADLRVQQRVRSLKLPKDYVSEINFRAEAWVQSVAEVLARGVVLLIDYGFPRAEYYHPQRREGTLMCHYRHRAHGNPLIRVGQQDITAHVDFTAIAQAAADAGLSLLGYTSQAAFLIANGIEKLISAADPNNVPEYLALTRQIKKLTLPQEMGELFKVIALGRGVEHPLTGFSLNDRCHHL